MYLSRSIQLLLVASAVYLVPNSVMAQVADAKNDLTLNASDRTMVIQNLQKSMSKKYVFPEVATKVNAMLAQHLKNGDYDKLGPVNT
ncbi:hypothetical protein [Undibacterium flavidum]|uniref:Uncharacterized protein n=1 Tax=Undibacterium flavidum TaxID=2762297 RepID=A0ABR6YB88_9BURK|nr:hypothetical protein [Undibacterium flavidum]MBC3873889.1 hypothetical protein [Undibacterium flavidum]